jgi:hypothetical protein
MKLLSWDQQLGLASPLPYAANQSGKTKTPSKNETGLDASRHTQVSAEGAKKNLLLDILFHRMSEAAIHDRKSAIAFPKKTSLAVPPRLFEGCQGRDCSR